MLEETTLQKIDRYTYELERLSQRRPGLLGLRNEAIREAHKQGASQVELAKITGLTRQRIQQLCDLSKETER